MRACDTMKAHRCNPHLHHRDAFVSRPFARPPLVAIPGSGNIRSNSSSSSSNSRLDPVQSWFLGDGILDVNPHTTRPVPLAFPTMIPSMWYEDNKIDEGRRAERRRHDKAVALLYQGHADAASRALAELRRSLEERLRVVLYSEADACFLRGDYEGALEFLNRRQLLTRSYAPDGELPDYKVHWMCGLCLANLGRLHEAVLHVQTAKRYVTCPRSALCITQLLARLRRQLGMPESDEDDLWSMPSLDDFEEGGEAAAAAAAAAAMHMEMQLRRMSEEEEQEEQEEEEEEPTANADGGSSASRSGSNADDDNEEEDDEEEDQGEDGKSGASWP